MSAAHWRRAMNLQPRRLGQPAGRAAGSGGQPPRTGRRRFTNPVRPRHVLVLAVLLAFPWVATPFFTYQIGAQALALGLIALSLTFLAGSGGMISLAQMTVAGLAGYMVAIFGTAATDGVTLGWPWWLAVLIGIVIAVVAATFIGWLSVRTEGIYTIMITLAIATAFFYFVRQNYAWFNGFNGFHAVVPPRVLGVYWRDPVPFYYLTLAVAGFFYLATVYAERSTFGLSLQAIRDNPPRMRALGFDVSAHRVFAFFLAGLIAGTAGVLLVWFNGQISPGTISVAAAIDVLVIAVVGGLKRPVGPYLGAILFVLLKNFAIDLIDAERFNTVIGLAFLLIVLFSPDGILGLWERLKASGMSQSLQDSLRSPPARSGSR